MMRISTHTAQVMERAGGIDQGFAMLRRAGIEGIQFGMGYYLMPAPSVRNNKPAAMDAPLDDILEMVRPYKEAAQKHGIAISQVHAPFPMWAQDNPALNERMPYIMQKAIAVTAYLESPHCVNHPAYTFLNKDRYAPEDEWAVNRALYSAMIPAIKQYKVMVLLENMFSRDAEGVRYASACNDYYEACQWIDALNTIAGEECFGFCFDTGHCNLARQNIYRAVKLLGGRLKALHMQDNSGHLDDHRAPFTGTVDWEGFIRGLKEIGYQGDLNFETGNAVSPYPAEMTEACLHMLALTGQYIRARLTA